MLDKGQKAMIENAIGCLIEDLNTCGIDFDTVCLVESDIRTRLDLFD